MTATHGPRPVRGGVTAPRGFFAGATAAGIRSSGTPDLALISAGPRGTAAAVFTTNRFRAAPVLVAEQSLRASGGRVAGVVVNAGCANAGTGTTGIDDARRVTAAAAERLGCSPEMVVPASTGLIGSRLPVDSILAALPRVELSGSLRAGSEAARAIMTTDTLPKERAAEAHLADGRSVRVGGMAKGAGMIHPQMATMLAFVTTDAPVEPELLRSMLRETVDGSFNQVTIDGDTSTNDAVVLLANGAAGGPPLTAGSREAEALGAALELVCRTLAMAIAADGEGAQRLIEVLVSGAVDDASARRLARTVAGSSLVKTAVHGADPNWGRIAAAAGRSGEPLDMERLSIAIDTTTVYAGQPCDFDTARVRRVLARRTVPLRLDMGLGEGAGRAWGCDLTREYVTINSEYTT